LFWPYLSQFLSFKIETDILSLPSIADEMEICDTLKKSNPIFLRTEETYINKHCLVFTPSTFRGLFLEGETTYLKLGKNKHF